MAHHKRKRRKDARAGCLLCKPHKSNGFKGTKMAKRRQERRADEYQAAAIQQIGWGLIPDAGQKQSIPDVLHTSLPKSTR